MGEEHADADALVVREVQLEAVERLREREPAAFDELHDEAGDDWLRARSDYEAVAASDPLAAVERSCFTAPKHASATHDGSLRARYAELADGSMEGVRHLLCLGGCQRRARGGDGLGGVKRDGDQ
jgi:hypothetical protein